MDAVAAGVATTANAVGRLGKAAARADPCRCSRHQFRAITYLESNVDQRANDPNIRFFNVSDDYSHEGLGIEVDFLPPYERDSI